MRGHRTGTIALMLVLLAMLASVHTPSHARDWLAINDELMMDPASVTHRGELREVTVKLKGDVHNVLIFCKKRALLFNEKMVAASDTPAGTGLVNQVCDNQKKWYEAW